MSAISLIILWATGLVTPATGGCSWFAGAAIVILRQFLKV